MSKIFVLDSKYQPLNLVPGRARMLLNQGKAAIYRQYPLTIMIENDGCNCQKKSPIIKRYGGEIFGKRSNNWGGIPGISHKYGNAFYRKNNYKYG